jgi:hypothetical protein
VWRRVVELPPVAVEPTFSAACRALLALSALVLRRAYRAAPRDIALALLLAATTPLALWLSTAVMSDTMFGLLTLGSLLLVRAGWQRPGGTGLPLLLAGGGGDRARDRLDPEYVPLTVQGDPDQVAYFVWERGNSMGNGGEADLPHVQAALRARGASTEPLYCVPDGSICVYDWRPARPPV